MAEEGSELIDFGGDIWIWIIEGSFVTIMRYDRVNQHFVVFARWQHHSRRRFGSAGRL